MRLERVNEKYENERKNMETGVSLIAKERNRQINELGFDVANDDLYQFGELADAAICYAIRPEVRNNPVDDFFAVEKKLWPWDFSFWKPTPHDRIRELVKAGALMAAQIDRELLIIKRKQNG